MWGWQHIRGPLTNCVIMRTQEGRRKERKLTIILIHSLSNPIQRDPEEVYFCHCCGSWGSTRWGGSATDQGL